MASYARPLTPEDAEILGALDAAYAEGLGLEPLVSKASVSFYSRSGHAFVAVTGGEATGFALAHAVWNGARPVVQVSRLAVADPDDSASRGALLEAVTKSAYDAAVYDIQVHVPAEDASAGTALQAKDYRPLPVTVWERVLGSRSQGGQE